MHFNDVFGVFFFLICTHISQCVLMTHFVKHSVKFREIFIHLPKRHWVFGMAYFADPLTFLKIMFYIKLDHLCLMFGFGYAVSVI